MYTRWESNKMFRKNTSVVGYMDQELCLRANDVIRTRRTSATPAVARPVRYSTFLPREA